ncbi:MAG: tRNA-dihydrouridine synthase, partial [bacterium]|nr:tRNA-dihydrouridine synthase [bacterium]
VTLARIAQEEGAAALALHPRTKTQGFGGRANWDHIRQVKEAVTIPIIGNGDVKTGDDAREMLRETGCDGIMIGRAAMGDPWVFNRIRVFLVHGRREMRPQAETIKETFVDHLQMEIGLYGERQGILRMRKFAAWYTKGLPQSAVFRSRINSVVTAEECLQEVESFFSRLPWGKEVRSS